MKQEAAIEPTQAELGKRFREERLRLELTPEAVAHYCRMSVSAVFGWEAGRNRIPLSAATSLRAHGFDIERIICGKDQLKRIEVYHNDRKDRQGPYGLSVPFHLLRRYKLEQSAAFVYHNPADGADIASPGDFLLMSWLPPDDPDALVETPRTALLEPKRRDASELLCKVSASQKGKVKVAIGDTSGNIRLARLLELCTVKGALCCRLGCQSLLQGISGKSHAQRLAKVLDIMV